ncbi:hypothetical protein PT974_08443 [Cladobotryum mycophilum]|uniref:MARVEL domain-containing protein n=1 Tax=Cladobotryum mycophilum TaxID=491253 RepID=A0ABR0SDC7_9HYPO
MAASIMEEKVDADMTGILLIYILQFVCVPVICLLVWQIQRSRFEGELHSHNNFEPVQSLLCAFALFWAGGVLIYAFCACGYFGFNAMTVMAGASTVGLILIACVVSLAAYTTGYADGFQDAMAAAEDRFWDAKTDSDHRESVEMWLNESDW